MSRLMAASTGLAASNACADPPTRNSSSPDAACGFVPVTGASRNSHFWRDAAAASSRTQPGVSVLDSISTVPGATPASAPFSPSQTAREAASSATMPITTRACAAASRGEPATVAPSAARASAFSRLRLYTVTGNFSDSRRPAMPVPISPNPKIATCGFGIILLTLWKQRSPASLRLAPPAPGCAAPVRSLRIAPALRPRREAQCRLQSSSNRRRENARAGPGPAVRIEFEVVMLDIPQAVAHFRLARANLLPPQHARIALDHHLARHRLKIRVEHELGPDRTGANLRTRQVQIILLLELMIGKLVSGGHAHAPRHSRRIRKIDAGDFALFAAIFRVRGSFQGFAMRAQDRTRSFIEPFRRCANLPGRWAPSLDSPAKHLHAVGQVLVFRVHGLPFARTAQMRQARAGDEAPRRFAGMIHRRKQPPWRSAAINRVVIQQLLGDLSLRERAERQVRCKRLFHQRIHRFAIAQQAQPRLLYNCHAPRVLISNLHKPHHAFRLTRSPRSLRAPSHSRAIPAPAYCRQAPRTHSAPSVRPRRCTRKVRCLPPRPRSENIQPSASSGSPSRRGNCASARHGGSPARNTIRRARRFCALA